MILTRLVRWLAAPEHWTGPEGLGVEILAHLQYCAIAVAVAAVIAVPLGAFVAVTGRGGALVVGSGNALRALPTLGLVTLLVLGFGLGEAPALAGLVVLAVPSILAGTHAGISSVPPEVADAATGMGMSRAQRLWQVELPNALPLVLGGLRSAVLQVVATATVAAYVGLGGLGRVLLDGLKISDYAQMGSAAIVIAALAVALDLALAGLTRALVPRGIRLAAGSGGDR